MLSVNMFDAKTNLSKLVKLIESKEEDCILIAKAGKPVAQIVPYKSAPVKKRIGCAEGEVFYSGDFDELNDEIAKLFGVGV